MRSPVLPTVAVILVLLASCTRPSVAFAAEAPAVPDVLRGKLTAVSNGALTPLPEDAVGGKKFYALYFSAGWCPPCHVFTPKLVNFYNRVHAEHPEFEVIFVSNDHSEEEMRKYMVDYKMPWPAVRFDATGNLPQINGYAGDGIPCLVLVDAAGKVLADSFAGTRYLGPDSVMVELQRRLTTAPGR